MFVHICSCDVLRLAFTFNILRHQKMITVVDDITEVTDPVAKDNHPGLFRQLEIYLDMTVAINKIIHIGVVLDVFLGK